MSMYQQLREVWDELIAPDAPFAITEVNVRGNTIKAYANAPSSLREVWLASAAFAERDYIVYGDERISYAQAHQMVASVANWLRDQGVQPGDRIAIAMRNYPEWLLAYWAGVSIGVAVVGMNAWWAGPEMVYGLDDAQPRVLVCDDERLHRVLEHRDEIAADMIIVGVRLPGASPGVVPWSELVGRGGNLPDVTVDPDSDACIFYTSGTTGHPKGAELTHRGCVNNLMNLVFSATYHAAVAERMGKAPAVDPSDVPVPAALVTTPLFHVTANNCVAHSMTLNGGTLVHMYKWNAEEALQLIERERITAMTGVPVMARELLSHPDFGRYDTSSLLSLGGGGAQLPPDLVGKIHGSVATARPNTGYGMTETCGIITSISGDIFLDKPDSAGPAMPNYDIKLVDADGNEVADGEPGELWVKGATVIKGYINRPEATAESITDGWLHTGDVARIDEDGFLYIVDRIKDMVLRGGENVYCAEVESALYSHEAVAECSVFGVPDERLGEEVGVAIFCNAGKSVSADELRAHCSEHIARHKIPRYIWLLSEPLPRNASGKFLRRELRERLDPVAAA